jgi:hypothetical protein
VKVSRGRRPPAGAGRPLPVSSTPGVQPAFPCRMPRGPQFGQQQTQVFAGDAGEGTRAKAARAQLIDTIKGSCDRLRCGQDATPNPVTAHKIVRLR